MDAIASFPHPILADWLLTITEVRLPDGESILHVGEITYKDKPVIRITSAGSEATADLLGRFERWVDDHVAGGHSPVGEARPGESPGTAAGSLDRGTAREARSQSTRFE